MYMKFKFAKINWIKGIIFNRSSAFRLYLNKIMSTACQWWTELRSEPLRRIKDAPIIKVYTTHQQRYTWCEYLRTDIQMNIAIEAFVSTSIPDRDVGVLWQPFVGVDPMSRDISLAYDWYMGGMHWQWVFCYSGCEGGIWARGRGIFWRNIHSRSSLVSSYGFRQ